MMREMNKDEHHDDDDDYHHSETPHKGHVPLGSSLVSLSAQSKLICSIGSQSQPVLNLLPFKLLQMERQLFVSVTAVIGVHL